MSFSSLGDDRPLITEHHLTVKRTARFCTLGDSTAAASDIWIVCHGFAQLARTFVEEFIPIVRPGRLIVAPEALNRFYLNRDGGRAGASARIGATWMTREDRLAEIDDYVRYLDDLYREIVGERPPTELHVTALGFSQGTATISRWLVHGTSKLDRVILWSGLLPPEIDPAGGARDRLRPTALYLVAGKNDDLLNTTELRAQREALEKAGVGVHMVEFEGGHRLDRATLERLAR
jgi:predicted esterase